MRGIDMVNIEFALMVIAHNIRKWSKKMLQKDIITDYKNRKGYKSNSQSLYEKNVCLYAKAA